MCGYAWRKKPRKMSKPIRSSKAVAAAVALALLTALAMAVPGGHGAWAQDSILDQARAAGTIGERYDGLAVARDGATAGDKELVLRVNTQRREIYGKTAAAENATLAAVAAIYAKQIYDKAAPGTWFLLKSGQWVQK
jgi:uncharacterized protein YdbL (DUF1318 family)